MKRICITILLTVLLSARQADAQTFAEWFKQTKTQKKYLALQIAKFQAYLALLKDGYRLANDGLSLYRDISNGDWLQHLGFVDHLTAVSSAVRGYPKAAAVVAMVKQASRSYSIMMPRIRSSPYMKRQASELEAVFSGILTELTTEVNQLSSVLSPGSLSMSDEQRLKAIDAIYARVQQAALALEALVKSCITMEGTRARDIAENGRMQGWQ